MFCTTSAIALLFRLTTSLLFCNAADCSDSPSETPAQPSKLSLCRFMGLLRVRLQMSSIMHPNISQWFWETEHVHAMRTRQQRGIFIKAERFQLSPMKILRNSSKPASSLNDEAGVEGRSFS